MQLFYHETIVQCSGLSKINFFVFVIICFVMAPCLSDDPSLTSKHQKHDIGILVHLLYSNPKILYSPNGTQADEVIKKVNYKYDLHIGIESENLGSDGGFLFNFLNILRRIVLRLNYYFVFCKVLNSSVLSFFCRAWFSELSFCRIGESTTDYTFTPVWDLLFPLA